MRVYCAGPLFCPGEKSEMAELAAALQSAGYDTFLPQRDGFEGTALLTLLMEKDWPADEAQDLVNRLIYSFDLHQLLSACDATVANLNGRVTDEGVIVEAALTAMAGKPLVLWKEDSRAPFPFGDNPMLTGLAGFCIYHSIDEVVNAIPQTSASVEPPALPPSFRAALELGARLAGAKPHGLDAVLAIVEKSIHPRGKSAHLA